MRSFHVLLAVFAFLPHSARCQFPPIPDCASTCFDGTDIHTCALALFTCWCEPAARPTFEPCVRSACSADSTGLRQAENYRNVCGFTSTAEAGGQASPTSKSTPATTLANNPPPGNAPFTPAKTTPTRADTPNTSVNNPKTSPLPTAAADPTGGAGSSTDSARGGSNESESPKASDNSSINNNGGTPTDSDSQSVTNPIESGTKSGNPTNTTPGTKNSTSSGSPGLSTGAKIGIGVGIPLSVIIIGLLLYVAYLFGRRKRSKDDTSEEEKSELPELPDAPAPPRPYEPVELPLQPMQMPPQELPAAAPVATKETVHMVLQELSALPIQESSAPALQSSEHTATQSAPYYETAVAASEPKHQQYIENTGPPTGRFETSESWSQ